MDYYNTYILRYLMSNDDTRKASKDHWLKCYKEAIEANDETNTTYCARIIASIALADEYIKTHTIKEAGNV